VLELFQAIASHICQNGIDSLPIARQPEATRQAVLSYILQADVSKQEVAIVEDDSATGFWTASTEDHLLLLRGLLAGGVLEFFLRQKRWRVNYGPAHDRKPPTRLSVPYRAKENPAPRSEFSHPDAVMLLTCLSYYYSGLADDDLMSAFQHLVKSDQADVEYEKWVADAPMLPDAYWQLRGINLQDRQYCREHIFPEVRFSKAVIDYFLANLVFPKEMKEFSDKLSASGWDIGEIKHHPTAGFSGTNDSRDTLPLSVKQLDLPEQSHTNALVLEYLLRPENSVAYVPPRENLCTSDAETLIKHVIGLKPVTRVILDVGAQILELSNFEVAETWLKMTPNNLHTQAVVFVNDSDELCVVDRTGLVELLQISPYGKQMEACLVFLDEAHTRGIDLHWPQDYRAAVTLGPGITKDKLVQGKKFSIAARVSLANSFYTACMRLRKLGKGQSVVFCISQEIQTKILSLIGESAEHKIDIIDVLRWSVSETWADVEHSIPLWAVQGQRFERQRSIWDKVCRGAQALQGGSSSGTRRVGSRTSRARVEVS
jgi:hypothetical protein